MNFTAVEDILFLLSQGQNYTSVHQTKRSEDICKLSEKLIIE